jgi:hypothetical protein
MVDPDIPKKPKRKIPLNCVFLFLEVNLPNNSLCSFMHIKLRLSVCSFITINLQSPLEPNSINTSGVK